MRRPAAHVPGSAARGPPPGPRRRCGQPRPVPSWTGPKEIDGRRTEDSWRSHQVPLASARDTDEHLHDLETWLKSYRADELFDEAGKLRPEIASVAPTGHLRMSANPRTNGGLLLRTFRFHKKSVSKTAL
ncbi:hypothetical protein [Georgenia sp. SUBG003]|uniref:hypothetical protein n=1 Tax=Georgenia sp. SUBG003 TaxID=1497974 RepID=UPI003AB644F5